MSPLRVAKGQALGNDYLVIDAGELRAALGGAAESGRVGDANPRSGAGDHGGMSVDLARALCDRHTGLGSDGVLVAWTDRRPFGLRIWNPDGTGAEKSGNGLRIFCAWLHGRGLVGSDPFDVALPKDSVTVRVLGKAGAGALDIEVDMGAADFRGGSVGFETRVGAVDDEPLDLGDAGSALINTVSLGNPHCVVLIDAFERVDFEARGPALAVHRAFREGTNVQFARPVDRHTAEAWIWERGAGETLASGSSACAVAATLVRKGMLDPGSVRVRMPGGEVRVDVDGSFRLRLRGPAQLVYDAEVPGAVLAGWLVRRDPASGGA
ncbi:MAG: diaminopimelate epimerase [Gemmatimonadota bacterium]